MMTEASQEQIAALRERIRRAGQTTLQVRTTLLVGVVLAFILCTVPWFVQGILTGRLQGSAFGWVLLGIFVSGVAGLCVAVPWVCPVAMLYRDVRRDQLRQCLGELSPEAQRQVLEPLRSIAEGDTRKLLDSLTCDLRLPSELTPSGAPTGRGDEPTPTR
jgi:hypothetical protein